MWQPQLNQLPKSSTTVYSDPSRASQIPFPNFYQITTRTPEAISDYRALELEISHRYANGFLFNSSYAWAKNLSDNQGSHGSYSGTSFVDEQGGYSPTDSVNPREDYGNVSGTRRQHWLTTAIYELPVGRGKHYGSGMNRTSDMVLGSWQLSNILLLQTGPYMSAYFPTGYIDPSGTGSGDYLGGAQPRPDLIGNPNAGPHSRSQWFNNNAFACPGQTTPYTAGATCDVGLGSAPIGRFGTEHLGDLVGPGTFSLSSGLAKSIQIVENVSLHFEATFTNVLNHTNPNDPDLDLTQPDFGKITTSRGSDFGGSRTGQLSLKIQF
jgi:hypothetical protein